ncbi:MAG: hypothetical protein RJA70_4683 [Pseudomonadota bacterium]|jgi:simple sugar transport system permease protein
MHPAVRKWLPRTEPFIVEGIALAGSLCVFSVFLLAVGSQPLGVFGDMLDGAFGSSFSIQNTLTRAAPLMLTALCTVLPARVGLVVIGNEGALLLGGLGAVVAARVTAGLPPEAVMLAMLLVGGLTGGLWITTCGLLRQKRGVNETISSLLLYYIALAVFLWLVEGPLRDPSSLNKPATYPVGQDNMLASIPGTDVHLGLLFGVAACVLSYVLTHHTTFGFGSRVAGGNSRTALMMGLPLSRYVIVLCMLGGAAAGLAGVVEVSAIHETANASLNAGLGFAGILVAFVARQHPLAVIPVAILIGGIEASGGLLQRRHDLPDATVDVFQGILFVMILGCETLFGKFPGLRPEAPPPPKPAAPRGAGGTPEHSEALLSSEPSTGLV